MTVAALVSYCCVCDAEPGECAHRGHRYLDDSVFERGEYGWRCPDGPERERFEYPVKATRPRTTPGAPVGEARGLDDLLADLRHWCFLDSRLTRHFEAAHDADPARATWIAAKVIDGAMAGRLRSPDGLLASCLRKDGSHGTQGY